MKNIIEKIQSENIKVTKSYSKMIQINKIWKRKNWRQKNIEKEKNIKVKVKMILKTKLSNKKFQKRK